MLLHSVVLEWWMETKQASCNKSEQINRQTSNPAITQSSNGFCRFQVFQVYDMFVPVFLGNWEA